MQTHSMDDVRAAYAAGEFTQDQMAALVGRDRSTVSRHLRRPPAIPVNEVLAAKYGKALARLRRNRGRR